GRQARNSSRRAGIIRVSAADPSRQQSNAARTCQRGLVDGSIAYENMKTFIPIIVFPGESQAKAGTHRRTEQREGSNSRTLAPASGERAGRGGGSAHPCGGLRIPA